ncbi:MAG: urease accessory protein UreE [Burkholderiales bacterium]|jgi:urease accessory protein
MTEPLVLVSALGDRGDPAIDEALHALAHAGRVETLEIDPADLPRRRFHATTDAGTPCFVELPRTERLRDGAVLHLDEARAVVVRVGEQRWLTLRPVDLAAGIELGHLAGALHWRVRFDGGLLRVALDGPEDAYLARLRELRVHDRVSIVD